MPDELCSGHRHDAWSTSAGALSGVGLAEDYLRFPCSFLRRDGLLRSLCPPDRRTVDSGRHSGHSPRDRFLSFFPCLRTIASGCPHVFLVSSLACRAQDCDAAGCDQLPPDGYLHGVGGGLDIFSPRTLYVSCVSHEYFPRVDRRHGYSVC